MKDFTNLTEVTEKEINDLLEKTCISCYNCKYGIVMMEQEKQGIFLIDDCPAPIGCEASFQEMATTGDYPTEAQQQEMEEFWGGSP